MGRILGKIGAVLIVLLGVLYLLASADPKSPAEDKVIRAIIGLVLTLLGSGILIFISRRNKSGQTPSQITQKVELSGNTKLTGLTCKNCGGDLDANSVAVGNDGSVLVKCPYCKSAYQITEEPKW